MIKVLKGTSKGHMYIRFIHVTAYYILKWNLLLHFWCTMGDHGASSNNWLFLIAKIYLACYIKDTLYDENSLRFFNRLSVDK